MHWVCAKNLFRAKHLSDQHDPRRYLRLARHRAPGIARIMDLCETSSLWGPRSGRGYRVTEPLS